MTRPLLDVYDGRLSCAFVSELEASCAGRAADGHRCVTEARRAFLVAPEDAEAT